jgi:hypothetical protein
MAHLNLCWRRNLATDNQTRPNDTPSHFFQYATPCDRLCDLVVRFPLLPDFVSSSVSSLGSTEPHGDMRSYLKEQVAATVKLTLTAVVAQPR